MNLPRTRTRLLVAALACLAIETSTSTAAVVPVSDGVLYGVSNTGVSNHVTSTLYKIDPATGVGTVIGEVGAGQRHYVGGLAYDPIAEKLYGSLGANLVEIDPATATKTIIGSTKNTFSDLTFDPTSGKLYGINRESRGFSAYDRIFDIDTDTGEATLLGNLLPANSLIEGIAYDPLRDLFHGVSRSRQLYTFDPETLQGTHVGEEAIGGVLAYDENTDQLYAARWVRGEGYSLHSIDPNSGVTNVIGLTETPGLSGLTFAPAVPEPSTATLILGAIGGLACLARRHAS